MNQEEIDIVVGEIDETKLKSGLKIFDTKDISEFTTCFMPIKD